MTDRYGEPNSQPSREPSLGELVKDLADQGSDLVHAEVRLAEAKLAQRMQIAGPALIIIAIGGGFAFIALMTVMFAFGALLATSMSTVAAAAIIAVANFVIGGALYVIGRRRFARIFGGEAAKMGSGTADLEGARHG